MRTRKELAIEEDEGWSEQLRRKKRADTEEEE